MKKHSGFSNFFFGIGRCLKWLGHRVIILYVVAFLFCLLSLDENLVLYTVRLKVLNRLRPDKIDDLVLAVKASESPDIDVLEKFNFYYKNVVGSMPERADGWGLLGFCSYSLGHKTQAVAAYKKAIEISPDFFWFYHNLGLIYYNDANYDQAVKYFDQAMDKDPKAILHHVTTSIRLYMPILFAQGIDSNKEVYVQAQEAYIHCLRWLTLSRYHLKDYDGMFKAAQHAVLTSLDTNGDFFFYAGAALFLSGQFDASVVYLKKSLEKNSQNAEAYHYLGLSLRQMGQENLSRMTLMKEETLTQNQGERASLLEPQPGQLEIF